MKKRQAKKLSKANIRQSQFEKEVKRVKRLISNAENQGKKIPKSVKNLIKKPKTITNKRLENLKVVNVKTFSPKKKTKAKGKKLTQNQQAYRRERERIRRQVKRLEKRGYIVGDDVKTLIENPAPKKVTQKKINELKELTSNAIYDHSEYIEPDTGEVLSGREGRAIERSHSSKKGWENRRKKKEPPTKTLNGIITDHGPDPEDDIEIPASDDIILYDDFADVVIQNVLSQLDAKYEASTGYKGKKFSSQVSAAIDIIIDMINKAISEHGKGAVAEALLSMSIPIPTIQELYSGQIDSYCSDFVNALQKQGVITDEERKHYYNAREDEEEWVEPE